MWAAIVQKRLDELVKESELHKIRKQKKILLPSGARRIDMYRFPEKHGCSANLLIPIPRADIDRLLAQYDKPHLTQFGTDEEVALYTNLYQGVGSPELAAKNGWEIFRYMMTLYLSRV